MTKCFTNLAINYIDLQDLNFCRFMVEASASLAWLSVVINDAHMGDTTVSNKRTRTMS
jgi:hypothetical protein